MTERGSAECVRRESREQRYIIARVRDRIVGVVSVSDDLIAKLYVDPAHQGEGVGRALYDSAEGAIRDAGHGRVRLGAFPTAVPFYEQMGLSRVGEKAATGPLAGRTVVLMEKTVERAAT